MRNTNFEGGKCCVLYVVYSSLLYKCTLVLKTLPRCENFYVFLKVENCLFFFATWSEIRPIQSRQHSNRTTYNQSEHITKLDTYILLKDSNSVEEMNLKVWNLIWFLWGRHFLNQNSYRIKFTSDEIKKIIPFKLLLIVKYYLEKELN